MKLSQKFLGGIQQYKYTLDFSSSELADRVKLYLTKCPEILYRSDIIYNSGCGKSRPDGYVTRDGVPFGEVITNVLLCEEFAVPTDKDCTYNSGSRSADTQSRRKTYCDFTAQKAYCGNNETKLMHVLAMQGKAGEFRVVDYQVTTTNGQKDNIDIILEKNGNVYITEAKKFFSTESLVRCVLEIQTYYQKLNSRFFEKYECSADTLKKAVLFDEGSFAFKQLKSGSWAKKLLKKFDITVLLLSEKENCYHIAEFTE